MSKFTSGPWRGLRASSITDNLAVYDIDGGLIAKIGKRGAKETVANHRLIAASPDLYDVVKSLVELADSEPFTSIGHAIEHVVNARAALAKVDE